MLKYRLWKIKQSLRSSFIRVWLFGGRCAGCGSHTHRWCFIYDWPVCKDCNTDEIARDLADHVCNPNG
jgi:hypothetical protein